MPYRGTKENHDIVERTVIVNSSVRISKNQSEVEECMILSSKGSHFLIDSPSIRCKISSMEFDALRTNVLLVYKSEKCLSVEEHIQNTGKDIWDLDTLPKTMKYIAITLPIIQLDKSDNVIQSHYSEVRLLNGELVLKMEDKTLKIPFKSFRKVIEGIRVQFDIEQSYSPLF